MYSLLGYEVSTESGSDRVTNLTVTILAIGLDPVATALGTDSITKPYFAMPLPSITVSLRSTPGTFTDSTVPSGHLISTLSTLVTAPKPK